MPKPVKMEELESPNAESNGQPQKPKHPTGLRPFVFHGLRLNYDLKSKDQNTTAEECPFCGKENRLGIKVSTGEWNCFNCLKGNHYSFIRELWKISFTNTKDQEYNSLTRSRGLSVEVLKDWGIAKSVITKEWILPGFDGEGNICQLYVYRKLGDNKPVLMATPCLSHGFFHSINQGYEFKTFDKSKPSVYIAEGPWDGMRLQESLLCSKEVKDEDTLKPTKKPKLSILNSANVVAVPGCTIMKGDWFKQLDPTLFVLLYDNDYPKTNKQGTEQPPAGTEGVKRHTRILKNSHVDSEIYYLKWGDEGYTDEYPDGSDLRDLLSDNKNQPLPSKKVPKKLTEIFHRIERVPEEWEIVDDDLENPSLDCLPCQDYGELIESWEDALKWTDGLDAALSIMLASIVSTTSVGDQLWVKIIGPASCGKSTLCEAVSVANQYVMAKSTIRGFISGYMDESGEDMSLAARLKNMTLVTKDGDTILQSPNISQLLSEARDLYDTVIRPQYRNQVGRDYSGIRMTWILCGTSSLRSIDSSELGERFLDCVIMDSIDSRVEDGVLDMVALRADSNMAIEATEDTEKQQDPKLIKAMQLTGGYVNYLRENAQNLLAAVNMTDEDRKLCTRLGKFVAFMRARPSRYQTEVAEREFAARLVSQHVRVMKCVAAVLGKDHVDAEVKRRTIKVTMDTARGTVLRIVEFVYEENEMTMEGTDVKQISLALAQSNAEIRRLVAFLRQLGVLKYFTVKKRNKKVKRLRLTKAFEELYVFIMENYSEEEIEV